LYPAAFIDACRALYRRVRPSPGHPYSPSSSYHVILKSFRSSGNLATLNKIYINRRRQATGATVHFRVWTSVPVRSRRQPRVIPAGAIRSGFQSRAWRSPRSGTTPCKKRCRARAPATLNSSFPGHGVRRSAIARHIPLPEHGTHLVVRVPDPRHSLRKLHPPRTIISTLPSARCRRASRF